MTPFDRVVSLLKGAKQTAKGVRALCPAHPDETPSLDCDRADDGSVLLCCRSRQCSAESIVAALGLELRDLFAHSSERARQEPPPKQAARTFASCDEVADYWAALTEGSLTTYRYSHANGSPAGAVFRFDRTGGKKTFRPARCANGVWTAEAMEVPRPLFGLETLEDASPTELVFVVEGEKCRDAVASLGLAALTSPNGANAAEKADWTPLRGRQVVVVPDLDEAGRHYRDDVVRLASAAGAASVAVLDLESLRDGEDVADWIVAERSAGAATLHIAEKLHALASNAPLQKPKAEGSASEGAPPPPSPIETGWCQLSPTMFSTTPPPRRYLLRHPTKDGAPCDPSEGDGMLPRGKAGLLNAEGGAGKTLAVMALAVCLVTGRPWLGHYPVSAEGGHVLLLLGEEDAEEVHRRLWAVGRALNLTSAEKAAAAARIVALPLAGEVCALAVQSKPHVIVPSPHYQALRRMLEVNAPPAGWALIAIDPLSRFAGLPIDVDNFNATCVVQVVESLVRAPGNPTVLALHHSSKDARKNGTVDARGATGITDGVRWVAGLTCRDDGNVEFRQTKSNYSRPMPEAMGLARGPDGVLYATGSTAGAASRARDERELADRAAILASLRAVGESTSIDGIVAGARLKAQRGRALVRRMIDEGEIAVRGTSKRPVYSVAGEEPADETGREENTPYPRDGGTPSFAGGSDDVPNFRDAKGTPGTPTQDEGQPEQPKGRRKHPAGTVSTAGTAETEVA